MYPLPKEISTIIKLIDEKAFNTYVVGGSARDVILNKQPEDWDLATDGDLEIIKDLLEDKLIESPGLEYGVLRIAEGDLEMDLAALRIDSDYTDHRRPDRVEFTKDIEEDLKRRDFTVNAIAFHPQKGIIDPFDGRKDLKEKLIRTVGDPEEKFSQDPLRIMRGLRFAGQLDFDIQMDTFAAMQNKARLLDEISMDRKREELEKLLVSKNTGKALRMATASGALSVIFKGDYPPKKCGENGDIEILIQNIDRARKDVDLRLALFLLCFEKSRAKEIINDLKLGKKRTSMQIAAQDLLTDLYFCTDKYSLKRFIYLNGEDTYKFLNDLSKQQRDVYDIPGYRIESRYHILEDMKMYKEPIYAEDLAIKAKDLIEAGIVTEDKAGEMMNFLVDVVHRFPGINTREKLFKKAKSLKNPIKAKLRNIYLVK